jgi:trimeric autotransporter adhesin
MNNYMILLKTFHLHRLLFIAFGGLGLSLAQAQVYVQESANGNVTLTPGRMIGKTNPSLSTYNAVTVWGQGALANVSDVVNVWNTTAFGANALAQTTTNGGVTAVGFGALSGSNGGGNLAVGTYAMRYRTFGMYSYANVAAGFEALQGSSAAPTTNTGGNNVGIGYQALWSNTSANRNKAVGSEALKFNTTGTGNVALGLDALRSNTEASYNIGIGKDALSQNTIGIRNVAIGTGAMYTNVSQNNNTAIGFNAMYYTNNQATTADAFNTAVGYQALMGGTNSALNTGQYNAALGFEALTYNQSGSFNTANGTSALRSNTTGDDNTAIGSEALYSNTEGSDNTVIGANALRALDKGSNIVAVGYDAMRNFQISTAGAVNSTAIGYGAMKGHPSEDFHTGIYNLAAGHQAMSNIASGSQNTAIGSLAGTNMTVGTNNTAIGYLAQVPDGIISNQLRLGNTSISYAGVQVAWTATSDRRWKQNIQPLNTGISFVESLRPVIYHRKNNPSSDLELGLIAQEAQQALQQQRLTSLGLIQKDATDHLTIRYFDLLMPLVKAAQEQQTQLDKWQAQNEQSSQENDSLRHKNQQLREKIAALRAALSSTETSNTSPKK